MNCCLSERSHRCKPLSKATAAQVSLGSSERRDVQGACGIESARYATIPKPILRGLRDIKKMRVGRDSSISKLQMLTKPERPSKSSVPAMKCVALHGNGRMFGEPFSQTDRRHGCNILLLASTREAVLTDRLAESDRTIAADVWTTNSSSRQQDVCVGISDECHRNSSFAMV